jgi:hypothetical protein
MIHTLKDEQELLDRLRSQHLEGRPMRDRLYEIFAHNGNPIKSGALEWETTSTDGNTEYTVAPEHEFSAAKELMRRGHLVRTFEEDYGWKAIRRIEHFDDLKFGYDKDGEIVIFDFIPSTSMPDPIIRPDRMHRRAVERVKQMIQHDRALVDLPLRLTQGDIIRPITTNPNVVETRRRQLDFMP